MDKVWAHPWLNDACRRALQRKRYAFGTPLFERCRDECSQAYLDAFASYVSKTRGELKELAPSSRGWWKLSSSLLQRAGAREGIPLLKRTDDTWGTDACGEGRGAGQGVPLEVPAPRGSYELTHNAGTNGESQDAQNRSPVSVFGTRLATRTWRDFRNWT